MCEGVRYGIEYFDIETHLVSLRMLVVEGFYLFELTDS